jgi:cobalamin biosynthetic protein CobC
MRHGGDLAAAEEKFGRPADGWLDLSTGINPHAYPLPPLPFDCLARLPERAQLDALLNAARAAYGWGETVPVVAGPGSQAMIQLLPYLRVRGSVMVIGPTYSEHAYLWARAGHQVREGRSLAQAEDADVVVIVNPNNPSGRVAAPGALMRLAAVLARREGLLVVDEAFADVTPEMALGARVGPPGLIVLRSFGKFFGLAGVRLGFAAGDAEMVSELAGELGPWPVSGPALAAGLAALPDEAWIATMRLRLSVDSMRLDRVLSNAGLTVTGGSDLFRTVRHARAGEIHESLARSGIWCRSFDERPEQLRFGVPGDDAGFDRLAAALKAAL